MRKFMSREMWLPVALVLCVGLCLLVVAYSWIDPMTVEAPLSTEVLSTTTVPLAEAQSRSEPIRLRIPGVHIDAVFEDGLGLNSDQSVEVPETYTKVGWYKHGPTPGELGPAVILGHVDSVAGPAVFWSLGKVKVGDDIYVDRADGTTAHFQVTELQRVSQTDFPTLAVYGKIDHSGLRVITCSGVYSKGQQRYSHNLIVFARAV